MKSQAALKIIVMFTLLISDIDVFFLGVSMYEYMQYDYTIGIIAVGGMAVVYLGGVYFGAMQRYKLDAHIIQCCEQGACVPVASRLFMRGRAVATLSRGDTISIPLASTQASTTTSSNLASGVSST